MNKEKIIPLIDVHATEKEDGTINLSYFTAEEKEQLITKLNINSEVLLNLFDELVYSDTLTALVQLLVTPYTHINLLHRWLNKEGEDLDQLVKDTKFVLGM